MERLEPLRFLWPKGPAGEKCFAETLGAGYRAALIELKMSPDTHIYDLSFCFLDRNRDVFAGRFLLRLLMFYCDLSINDRRIFLCEYLERGRHYKFWWFEYFESPMFTRRKAAVAALSMRAFQ